MVKNKTIAEYVANQLKTNQSWATKAIVRLYQLQTADEQCSQSTHNKNGVGFTGADANILSSFAEQIDRGRTLSPKQLAIAFKKLPKYSRQIMGLIPSEKLEAMRAKFEVKLVQTELPSMNETTGLIGNEAFKH